MCAFCHTSVENFLKGPAIDMLNFDFLENDLGMVSPPHFVYDFWGKIFLMLHSINWPNFTVWLHLFLEILGNVFAAIAY